ncbi:hypothetical protein CDEST_06411 [Colletotrichum destructivum]|uniref:Uncharacterized protein n=1 Tax=Colletotrichum destructivum TaxID=34406 RepID=A0AAX4IDG6_9PEZI|nr:hypothetical protein CDEST_06411 [Colletotrichum destructivum]
MNFPLNLPSDNRFANGLGGVSEKLKASMKSCEAGEQHFSLKNVSKTPSANPFTFDSDVCITCLFCHVTNHSTQLLARDSAILSRLPFLFNMPSVPPTLLHWQLVVGPSSFTTTESRNSLSLRNLSIFLHTTSLSVFHSVAHTHTLRLSVCVSFSHTHIHSMHATTATLGRVKQNRRGKQRRCRLLLHSCYSSSAPSRLFSQFRHQFIGDESSLASNWIIIASSLARF